MILWSGADRVAVIRFPLGWGRPGVAISLREAIGRVRAVPGVGRSIVWSHAPAWEPDERRARERVLWAFGAATIIALLPGIAFGGMWWATWLFPAMLLVVSAMSFAAEWITQSTGAMLTRDGRLLIKGPRRTREMDLRAASRVDVLVSRSDPDAWEYAPPVSD